MCSASEYVVKRFPSAFHGRGSGWVRAGVGPTHRIPHAQQLRINPGPWHDRDRIDEDEQAHGRAAAIRREADLVCEQTW